MVPMQLLHFATSYLGLELDPACLLVIQESLMLVLQRPFRSQHYLQLKRDVAPATVTARSQFDTKSMRPQSWETGKIRHLDYFVSE